MKKLLFANFVILLLVCFSSTSSAQSRDWKKELNRDLVTVSGGKMKFSELELCTIKNKSKAFQIQWNATAPQQGVISRDNFVAMITSAQNLFKVQLAKELGLSLDAYAKKVSCEPAEDAIGNVDLEISVTMSKGGLQMNVKKAGSNEVKQTTTTWAQVFKK